MPIDGTPPMKVWTLDQLNARYIQMAKELETALQDRDNPVPGEEEVLDPTQRWQVGMWALRLRKITWEMGNVAEEWRRRDGERRW